MGLRAMIQARAVKQAAADQRQFLLVSTKAKKPDMASPAFSELIKDLQQRMTEVTDIKDNNRDLTFKDHLSMVGEGVSSLQWLVMDGKPADFVGEILGGAQLFGNRILKAYKEKCVDALKSQDLQKVRLTMTQRPNACHLRTEPLRAPEIAASLYQAALRGRRDVERKRCGCSRSSERGEVCANYQRRVCTFSTTRRRTTTTSTTTIAEV